MTSAQRLEQVARDQLGIDPLGVVVARKVIIPPSRREEDVAIDDPVRLLSAGQTSTDDRRPVDPQLGADVLHLDHMHIAIGHLFDRRAKGVARLELGHLGKHGS